MRDMRELRFRAWDKDKNKWVYARLEAEGWHIVDDIRDAGELEDWQEFTGLKDRTKWEELTEDQRSQWTRDGNFPSEWNGVEIWDQDIVSYGLTTRIPRIKVVHWGDGGWRLAEEDNKYHGSDTFIILYSTTASSCEVIGNIYENPELLEGK